MLAYVATKRKFLDDAPQIEDLVRDAVFRHLNLKVGKSEYEAWRNSLGNAMFHVMNDPEIHDDAGIAVEYRLNG
ncbi:MAG: AAA family ATPase, partial [Actinobacteria bacterium]|nr:AAA family ATPase [Actinomycetota bacterium]